MKLIQENNSPKTTALLSFSSTRRHFRFVSYQYIPLRLNSHTYLKSYVGMWKRREICFKQVEINFVKLSINFKKIFLKKRTQFKNEKKNYFI